jgi:hypothetical protein
MEEPAAFIIQFWRVSDSGRVGVRMLLTPKGRNQILGSFLNLGQATVSSNFTGF